MKDLPAHQAAVLAAHARYSVARKRLLEIAELHREARDECDSARTELDVLATRAP